MEPARVPSSPVAVPTLMDLLADPSAFDALPRALQDTLYEQAAGLEARLRAKVLARHRPEERAGPDRALRILQRPRLSQSVGDERQWVRWVRWVK